METKFTNIKERILQITDFKRISKEKFFEDLGVTYGNFKGKAKEKSLSSDVLATIVSKFPDLNSEWLLTGKGDMLKEEIAITSKVVSEPMAEEYKISKQNIGIPLIPIEAMAGYGAGETQILELDCERFMVPTFKGADFLIQVKGSSMYPKYNSGDIVACKKLNLNDVFFQWNKVYVLDTEQGALIKRIDLGKDNEHILIVSDNEKYKPFQLHRSKLNAIAIVMGVIRLE